MITQLIHTRYLQLVNDEIKLKIVPERIRDESEAKTY